jgi:hypothetical protein
MNKVNPAAQVKAEFDAAIQAAIKSALDDGAM